MGGDGCTSRQPPGSAGFPGRRKSNWQNVKAVPVRRVGNLTRTRVRLDSESFRTGLHGHGIMTDLRCGADARAPSISVPIRAIVTQPSHAGAARATVTCES